jgi:hypothetical protein
VDEMIHYLTMGMVLGLSAGLALCALAVFLFKDGLGLLKIL